MRPGSSGRVQLEVTGMHCASCGLLIDDALEDLPGVLEAVTHVRRGRTEVRFDPSLTSVAELLDAVRAVGYEARPADR
ncbi:MAG: cation transporter [Egibacteraceae bacterium]